MTTIAYAYFNFQIILEKNNQIFCQTKIGQSFNLKKTCQFDLLFYKAWESTLICTHLKLPCRKKYESIFIAQSSLCHCDSAHSYKQPPSKIIMPFLHMKQNIYCDPRVMMLCWRLLGCWCRRLYKPANPPPPPSIHCQNSNKLKS